MDGTREAALFPAGIQRCRRQRARGIRVGLAMFIGLALLWPVDPLIPVQGATRADWHPRSFWHHPWGASGAHKGIDIFAPEGRPVLAATSGLVLRSGIHGAGGNGSRCSGHAGASTTTRICRAWT